MIIAHLFGGPRDGLVVATPTLTPLIFPLVHGNLGAWLADPNPDNPSTPEPVLSTITYLPRRATLQLCSCMPGWAHPTAQPSVDQGTITYTQHHTCTYYLAGWRG